MSSPRAARNIWPVDDVRRRVQSLMRRSSPDSRGRATLRQRHIYILPTRYGFILSGILILMLLGALNYGSNLGFFYTFLLSGIGFGLGRPVFAGQMIQYIVFIENNSRFERPAIELQVGESEPVQADLPGNGKVELMLSSVAKQRGYQRLGRVTV